jgi:hypothetical protein
VHFVQIVSGETGEIVWFQLWQKNSCVCGIYSLPFCIHKNFPKRNKTKPKEDIEWAGSLFYLIYTLERLKIRSIVLVLTLVWLDCSLAATSVMVAIVMRIVGSPNATFDEKMFSRQNM